MTEQEYGDFELELDYKLATAQSNSGIYLRAKPAGRISRTALEVQIDAAGPGSGGITPYLDPTSPAQKPPGQWNALRMRCDGGKVEIYLNDLRVLSNDLDAHAELKDRPRRGVIGIANWKGLANGMEFRNIRLRELNVDPATTPPRGTSTTPPTSVTPATTPLPKATSTATATNRPTLGFTSLFNGRDLTGWQASGGGTGNWVVENGAITCRGGPFNRLFTQRGDYVNFQLRAEVMISDGGNGGLHFRTPPGMGPGGYEAQVNSTAPNDPNRTGSIYIPSGGGMVFGVKQTLVPPNTWFVYQVNVVGNRMGIFVDGKPVADYTDAANKHPVGHIALEHHDAQSKIYFRKVEIKELK
jgi:hypothetical protein